jgi:hypothetical protein
MIKISSCIFRRPFSLFHGFAFISRIPPAPAPSPANPLGLDSTQAAGASSSKPPKSALAFDPLGGRGGRKKQSPAPAAPAAAAATKTQQNDEEYTEDERNDMSAGLSQLLAELARGRLTFLKHNSSSIHLPSKS